MAWVTYNFSCGKCAHRFDDMVQREVGYPDECPECHATENFTRFLSAPALMGTIVPSYPGSKRLKAGYQHTHNRAAEKKERQVSMYTPKKGSK